MTKDEICDELDDIMLALRILAGEIDEVAYDYLDIDSEEEKKTLACGRKANQLMLRVGRLSAEIAMSS